MGVDPQIVQAVDAAGSIISAASLITIQMVGWLKQKMVKCKAQRENIENLFGFLRNADITADERNPWVEEWEISSAYKETTKLFKKWIESYFKGNREIEFINGPIRVPNVNEDLCSIGGPAHYLLTRHGMGYDQKGESWIPVLPFYYPLKEVEARGIFVRRKYKGREQKSPSWFIADRSGKPLYIPKTDRYGFLERDYFMLIVTPNVFTTEAFYTGKKHMMITPAHSFAALAIREILDSDEVLKWLIEASKQTGYYQAILEIPGIKHKENEYVPGKPIPCEVKPLDSDDFKRLAKKRGWIK